MRWTVDQSRALGRRRTFVVRDRFEYDVDVEWIIKHALHDLLHYVLDIRKGYAMIALDASDGYTVRAATRPS